MLKRFSHAALGGLLLSTAFCGTSAFAADAKAIADAFAAAVTASGKSTATYTDASASGDDVTVSGLTLTQTEGSGDTISIPQLVITGATPRDKGGFTATSMAFDNVTIKSDKETTVTWKTGSVADATVPSADEVKAKAKIRPFSKLDIAGLNVTGGDLPAPLDIASVGMTIDTEADGTPKDFNLNISSIALPSAFFAADPQSKAMVDALGYTDGFTLDVGMGGAYETASDTLTLRNFTFAAPDVGKLDISGKFSGVPLSKLASDQPADVGTTGKLDALTIRFDNLGIVERALDMQAKMMGASRDDVVNQIGGALPFMLSAIGNQGLQDKIAAAGQAFLKDPKSITITAAPAAPVPFSQIMSTGMSAPNTLPDLLVVDVAAHN